MTKFQVCCRCLRRRRFRQYGASGDPGTADCSRTIPRYCELPQLRFDRCWAVTSYSYRLAKLLFLRTPFRRRHCYVRFWHWVWKA